MKHNTLIVLSLLNALFFGLHLTGDIGGLGSAAVPVVHTMGRPLGERFTQLPGGFFFIWTLLTSGFPDPGSG